MYRRKKFKEGESSVWGKLILRCLWNTQADMCNISLKIKALSSQKSSARDIYEKAIDLCS